MLKPPEESADFVSYLEKVTLLNLMGNRLRLPTERRGKDTWTPKGPIPFFCLCTPFFWSKPEKRGSFGGPGVGFLSTVDGTPLLGAKNCLIFPGQQMGILGFT